MDSGVRSISMELYRFQILPRSLNFQFDAFEGIDSIEELVSRKNDLFNDRMRAIAEFKSGSRKFSHSFLLQEDTWTVFKLAAHKIKTWNSPELIKKKIPDYPFVYVVIDSHPDQQLLAISKDTTAFQSTAAVTRILENNFNRILQHFNLAVYISPLKRVRSFWQTMEIYEGRIAALSFSLISPNMPGVSKALTKVNLHEFKDLMNSQKTDIAFQSGKGDTLVVEQDNEVVNELAQYTSEGGGSCSFRLKGYRKKMNAHGDTISVELDEWTLTNASPDALAILRSLLGTDGQD